MDAQEDVGARREDVAGDLPPGAVADEAHAKTKGSECKAEELFCSKQ